MFKPNSPAEDLEDLHREVVQCTACPRLVSWREQVAGERRAAFSGEEYWGRPVPGFGDPAAALAVVGLAPAAHGGNRTGRVFTGDRSGDWLFSALHRFGFANQASSLYRNDGLHLRNAWVTAAVKCAPPANKPTTGERNLCTSKFLARELEMLANLEVIVCLGKFAYDAVSALLGMRRRPSFGHGVEAVVSSVERAMESSAKRALNIESSAENSASLRILCSFHPSQQNTFTKKLTVPMFDAVFERAARLVT